MPTLGRDRHLSFHWLMALKLAPFHERNNTQHTQIEPATTPRLQLRRAACNYKTPEYPYSQHPLLLLTDWQGPHVGTGFHCRHWFVVGGLRESSREGARWLWLTGETPEYDWRDYGCHGQPTFSLQMTSRFFFSFLFSFPGQSVTGFRFDFPIWVSGKLL